MLRTENLDDIAFVDPASMNMHFGAGLLSERNREVSTQEGVGAVLPVPAMAHEVAHVWQVTTTMTGIRWFWDAHLQMRMMAAMTSEASKAAAGIVGPRILVDPMVYEHSSGFRRYSDIVNALTAVSWCADGGHQYRPEELESFFGGPPRDDHGMSVYPDDRIGAAGRLRFFDLGQVRRASGSAASHVLLGTKHLFEGLSAAVEGFRNVVERPELSLAERQEFHTLRFLPFEPYGIAAGMYAAIAQHRLGDQARATALVEIMAIIDAALNMDDWLEVLVRTGEIPETGGRFAFDNYLKLLEARADAGSAIGIRDGSAEETRTFQETLLRAVGAPMTNLAELPGIAAAGVDRLFDELRTWSPVPPGMLTNWRTLFMQNLSTREDIGGGSPFFEIARAPREALREIFNRVPMRSWGPAQIHEEEATGPVRQAFQAQMVSHMRSLLMEWSFGRRRCEHFDGPCRLSERPACDGLTADLSPSGTRCPREAMTAHLMANFSIVEIPDY
ncbi:hypothetical protein [Micromonospora sp. CP22]|uniref:hypothetical protein n=1 Tax=Micromonospora sp. CP22 TaxID=2580517 RepID=UPI0018AD1FA9|nr:hypothetical protein [Micromonospora sp. CP22]